MKLKFWLTALVLVLAMLLPPAVTPPQPAQADVAGTLWYLTGVDAANNPNLGYINISNVVSFDLGYHGDHSLVVKDDGTVWAWGYNTSGQLGNGATATSYVSTPVQVKGVDGSGFLTNVKAATAGDGWSVAVKNDGTVWAWGGNGWGELGTGAGNQGEGGIAYSTTPVQVIDSNDASGYLQNVTAVSAGMDHTLALKTNGTVWGWGGSGWGQLGNGTSGNHYGTSNTYYISHPVQASGLTEVKSICASNAFSVVLKNDGSVWTFGCNTWSNLGINKTSAQVSGELSPVQVLGPGGSGFLSGIDAVSARGTHVLAFQSSSGSLYGWGANTYGALAQTSTSSNYAAPFVVATIPGSTSGGGAIIIDAGLSYSLVKNPSGTLTGWGDGFGTPGTSVNVNIIHDVTNISGKLILGPDRTPTTTTVVSSSQPSYVGDNVTFTATVTGAGGIPTGIVLFSFGGASLETLNGAGQASVLVEGEDLYSSSNQIVANYNGDYNYAQSTSEFWQTVIKRDCTAVLTSSPNPSLVGDTVTYTLTVSGLPAKPPSGNWVDFTGGYPSILLDATGIVVFTDSTLAAGSYQIKATYRGDDNYNKCESNEITQVVNEQPPPPPPPPPEGLAWTTTGGVINTSRIHALAYDSVHNLLYAGMSTGIDGSQRNGVWCYDGSTWTSTGGGLSDEPVWSLAYDTTHNILYAGTLSLGVWRYDGSTWTNIDQNLTDSVWSLAYDSTQDILYAGTEENGVWYDYGVSWGIDSPGNVGGGPGAILSLVYDPALQVLYASTDTGTDKTGAGVEKFDVNTNTWSQLGDDLQGKNVHSLALDTTHNLLYAGTEMNGVWVYNGTSWTRTSGFNSFESIHSLAYYPAGNLVYTGTDRSGVWSYDGGSWTSTGGYISSFDVQALACDSTHNILYAGTTDHGVWSTPISASPPPDVVVFPDANLEAAIRSALNQQAGDIHKADLETLTSLTASYQNISDLTGLQYCTGLTNLDLDNNNISDISELASLSALTSLNLSHNPVSNIGPLSSLSQLSYIGISWSQVSDITPLQHLNQLNTLDLTMSQITDISPITGLANLAHLNLNGNQIGTLPDLSGWTSMVYLDLGQIQITDASGIEVLSNLVVLNLYGNPIGDNLPDFSQLPHLIYLGLYDDQITTLPDLSGLNSLTTLYLMNNQITSLSGLPDLPALSDLYLNNNQITDISPLSGFTQLQYLALDHNQITDISALVNNSGIGSGDTVGLTYNYLDTNSGSQAMADIQNLINRGAQVTYLPQNSSITITSPMPDGQVGVAYTQQLTASGGTPTYSWSIIGGSLPPSLNLVSDTISGAPSAEGTFNFTVQVIDNNGLIATKAFSVTINPAPTPLTIDTPSPLPDGQVGVHYSQALDATGGKPSYIWSIQGGNLPPDLSLNFKTISGTPSTAGTYSFTVQVLDEDGTIATKVFSITIAPLSLVTIDVVESISVNDSCEALPPAVIDLVETIGVNDSCQALPPVTIDLTETIGVNDSVQPLPAASIEIVESIGVSDQETATASGTLPTTISISPTSRFKGAAAFSMTVTGTNFTPTSVVRFAGGDRPTTFVSSTQLTASIPATDLGTVGHYNVTVYDLAGGESNAQIFTVYSLAFQLHSPVDLYLTDPDGLHIGLDPVTNQTVNQIADADFSGPGTEPELISILTLKTGDYVVKVIPRAGVSPTDTYTLTVSFDGNTIILANNVSIGNIPGQGYTIKSSASGLSVWNYSFSDSQRHTQLYINTDNGTFQFISPEKVYPVKKATIMKVIDFSKEKGPPVKYNSSNKKWSIDVDKLNLDKDLKLFAAQYQSTKRPDKIILINHKDRELQLSAVVVDGDQDSCIAFAKDLATKKTYFLIDRGGQSWTYTFYDQQNNTALSLNMPDQLFQLTIPDKQFAVKQAPMIRTIDPSRPNVLIYNPANKTWKLDTKKLNLDNQLKALADQIVFTEKPQKLMLIYFQDKELQLSALITDGTIDYCVAYAKDIKTGKIYQLVDKP